ncbi:GNAT family N-acetyltransferase [Allosphingosinicella flava]|uniref:GNAT family N-acetyltransferase n=1 Tax=Allosphingosinicella flava TaxID=2771430 RepID=A0A7T2GJ37_9SPHN|nr:GNAT family N-acetyltransferase [Sphingosinicella flava]QPQ54807.1 GNAT family N-acetyltransferase [Sphingosinicella flava]
MPPITVRPFARDDVPQLLALMRELALFEDYIDAFAVTEADILAHGLGPSPCFGAFVALWNDAVIGTAVHHVIPWTYDLKPTLVLKELYVAAPYRGCGAGRALMGALAREARRIGAARIVWGVLNGNRRAEHFYARLGGRPDRKFAPWSLDAAAIAALACAT